MRENKGHIFKLKGKIQHYAWGGREFLPQLLHIGNPALEPFAEYWLGAHDKASSEILIPQEGAVKLNDFICLNPRLYLGAYVEHKFKRLPFLLKILDVRDMLSIQVHPTKENAEIEFARENARLIPLDAPKRNYHDDNHKPELMYALSEFWLLHGFKSSLAIERILENVPELGFLGPAFQRGGYFELYKTVMTLDQVVINQALDPLVERIVRKYLNNELHKKQEDYWAARAAITFNKPGRIDKGIFSIYLFNLVHLHPGEAVFQKAGLPHAYLEGQNVEIMSNSDNVLRGGLTSKHIDVDELLKHIRFEHTIPQILTGEKRGDHAVTFITEANDFEFSTIELNVAETLSHHSRSVEIYFVSHGGLTVSEVAGNSFEVEEGEAFAAFHDAAFTLNAKAATRMFLGSVPMPSDVNGGAW